jgi:hypothetical protein
MNTLGDDLPKNVSWWNLSVFEEFGTRPRSQWSRINTKLMKRLRRPTCVTDVIAARTNSLGKRCLATVNYSMHNTAHCQLEETRAGKSRRSVNFFEIKWPSRRTVSAVKEVVTEELSKQTGVVTEKIDYLRVAAVGTSDAPGFQGFTLALIISGRWENDTRVRWYPVKSATSPTAGAALIQHW